MRLNSYSYLTTLRHTPQCPLRLQSSLIVSQLVSQWSTLSRFLPASFPGKYDKDVFQATIQGSLVSMGFMALAGAYWGEIGLGVIVED